MPFAFMNEYEPVAISRRNLPHWEQAEKTFFITFRTFDSLPEAAMAEWLDARDRWLRKRGINPASKNWQAALARLPERSRREFRETFSDRLEDMLDDCHGECVLRGPELAKIVADALLHFDGDRYHLGDFVVMPNHVHLVVQFLAPDVLKPQCKSWKKYTAGEINEALGRRGHFWQDESYDHLVRDPEEFFHYREYIANNPAKANLNSGEYWHYKSPKADQFVAQGLV